MDLDNTSEELATHITALYTGLPSAFAAELNEIEFRLGHNDGKQFVPDVGVIDFDTILKAYIGKYGPPTQQVMLTLVEQGGVGLGCTKQIRILTVDNIKAYCITGKPGPGALCYTKKKQSYTIPDQPLRVSFGQETPFILASDSLGPKVHFRYAQRFSFASADGGAKFDFTVIHEGNGANVHESGVLDPKSPEKYEIEVEFSTFNESRIAVELDFLLRCYHGGIAVEPLSRLTRALNGYIALCNASLRTEPSPVKMVSTCLPMLYHGDANTIVKHFCQDLMPDISEILSDVAHLGADYVVTDKADGRRAFLYTHEGRAYLLYKKTIKKGKLIQGALAIIPTGLAVSPLADQSLYDGEFIFIEGRPFFLCFDVLLGGIPGLTGYTAPFHERLAHIARVIANPDGINGYALNICRKTFVPASELKTGLYLGQTGEGLTRILDHPKITYPLDGLIFQKRDGLYPQMGQKWTGTMKWKPPGETTMDFKITSPKRRVIVPGNVLGEPAGLMYWRVVLIYGFNSACRFPGYLLMEGNVARVKENHAVVDVGDIIECRLHPAPDGSFYWTGVRLRRDKRFPNNETTYNGNMSAIKSAISLADLQTGRVVKPLAVAQTALVNPMTTVNKYNRRVSNQHIYNYASEVPGGKIFEFAVGSAQSASAWKFAHVSQVVGIDIIPDTVKNVELSDGFFKRENRQVKSSYFVADMCTDLLKHPEVATVSVKVDLAVCNFAIHYAFKSEQSLKAFLKNIVLFLKPGGYFVGTYMARQAIAALPSASDALPDATYTVTRGPTNWKVGVTGLPGQNVWCIERSADADQEDKSIYGNSITVDIAERPLSQEYYINLDSPKVHAVFAEFGFAYIPEADHLRKPVLFQFKTNLDSLNRFEKRWADIHRPFVFKYTGAPGAPGAPGMPPRGKMTFKRKAPAGTNE